MSNGQSHKALNDTVVANGYCIGCGACAVPPQSAFKMALNEYGQYQASLNDLTFETAVDYERLCPFGDSVPTEDEIARPYFSSSCEYNSQVGFYQKVYAGYVAEGSFRLRGSSGGMSTWMLNELMVQGKVDYVIHVKSISADEDVDCLPFTYQISQELNQVQQGGKSRYYPIELSEVLKKVREQPGRYAFVGLPCFIKSIRLLQASDQILADRIQYCVGLVCGHLKSAHYAESLAWQMGVVPAELKGIDFRLKDPLQPADRYSTYVKGKTCERTATTSQLFGADWGMGAFKYKACDFCDDVFAETADVVFGDAWLPEYVQDSDGTNVVVTRNSEIQYLIEKAIHDGRLTLEELPVEKAIQSQDAGLRHRKVAIAYRLYCEQESGVWTPKKRTRASSALKPKYEMDKQRFRTKLRNLSHAAFLDAKRDGNLASYIGKMQVVYRPYRRIGRSFIRRVLSFAKRKVVGALKP